MRFPLIRSTSTRTSLTIRKLIKADNGIYECRATNEIATIVTNTQLQVECKYRNVEHFDITDHQKTFEKFGDKSAMLWNTQEERKTKAACACTMSLFMLEAMCVSLWEHWSTCYSTTNAHAAIHSFMDWPQKLLIYNPPKPGGPVKYDIVHMHRPEKNCVKRGVFLQTAHDAFRGPKSPYLRN